MNYLDPENYVDPYEYAELPVLLVAEDGWTCVCGSGEYASECDCADH